ncbi:MAG TPA: hypothetical protein VGH81_07890 [Rudaea sp.]|jgi:predicted outer membrane repeat protein
MFKYLLSVLSIIALIGFSGNAAAFCFPKVSYRCVGDHAVDAAATDATIQLAITNTTCPRTVITITHEIPSALSSLALEINGKSDLTLVGVPVGETCAYSTSCDPEVGCGGGGGTPPAPTATLHGNGAGSVIYIHGSSSVTLESLELTGGGGTDFGGGIHFTGSGALTIINSTITGNNANSQGGGIQFNGSGGNATLTLSAGTLIDENTSGGNGGGIHINGSARLMALQPYTEIGFNHAPNGFGGGIQVEGPAQADIGSPGYNGLGVVYGNDAEYGGGISGYSVDGYWATVRLFTTDASNPVTVSSNFASHTGGGIYLRTNGPNIPDFCAYDFRIDNNAAQEGSAIYGDEDSEAGNYYGAYIFLNSGPQECQEPETIDTLGAVRCAAGIVCNTVNGNVAEDSSNHPTAGSTILAQTAAGLIARRLIMRNNHGAHVIRTFGPYGSAAYGSIVNCLIADNTLTAEMIRIDDDGLSPAEATSFDGCTIVNNGNQGAPVIYSAHALTLTNSIIDELSINTLNYVGPGGGLNVSDVLATDISTLPSAAGIDQGEPLYVDAANSDYHLQPTSTGIDFAPANGGVDLDGNPRDVNLSGVPGNSTPRDIGAYERQNKFQCGTSDSIFCNGYEYSW